MVAVLLLIVVIVWINGTKSVSWIIPRNFYINFFFVLVFAAFSDRLSKWMGSLELPSYTNINVLKCITSRLLMVRSFDIHFVSMYLSIEYNFHAVRLINNVCACKRRKNFINRIKKHVEMRAGNAWNVWK